MKTKILTISRQRRPVRMKINEVQKFASRPAGNRLAGKRTTAKFRHAVVYPEYILTQGAVISLTTAGNLYLSNEGAERKGEHLKTLFFEKTA